MDATYPLADKVELITPARFLFDAGQTPKAWNDKMLNDSHLKVLHLKQMPQEYFLILISKVVWLSHITITIKRLYTGGFLVDADSPS